MIFSRFFKAKWQNKDSNIRIEAINTELNGQVEADYKILVDLLNNDVNELVRRAVLLKVQTFALWLSTSSENSNKKVREYAAHEVAKMLHGDHVIILSADEKTQYLAQASIAQIEAWLPHEKDTDIIIALFEKLNKPHLLFTLFNQHNDITVQTYCIEHCQEPALLEKMLKKSVNESITATITEKLNALTALAEKPKKLVKQLHLSLAKLLALKEGADYAVALKARIALEQQWQSFQTDLPLLTSVEQSDFSSKFIHINEQLDKAFLPKEEAYQQQLIASKLASDKAVAKAEFDQQLQALSLSLSVSLSNAIADKTVSEENETESSAEKASEKADAKASESSTELTAFTEQVNQSVLNDAEKQHYRKAINNHAAQLKKLPEMAKLVAEANVLMEQMSSVAVPTSETEFNDVLPVFEQWKKQWKTLEKKAQGILPQSLNSAYMETCSLWHKVLKPFTQQQKQALAQTQKKLADLKRLHSQGKFNACFGIFKGLQKSFAALNDNQQQRLQREFDQATENMAELSDWEHYIATPKKQQLLAEINAIIVTPLDNPNEQANAVKVFRQRWNALGHAEEGQEAELNLAFNKACEDAFAPCRLFFSEQEKIREQNLITRNSILEQAKMLTAALDASPVDYKNLEAQINKVSKTWQAAGEVDRDKFRALNNEFTRIIQPIKSAIKQFYDENSALKQALIEKAEQSLLQVKTDSADIYQAISAAKGLQSQWGKIGFAGSRHESRLWQTFRNINNELFSLRDDNDKAQKAENVAKQTEFESQLAIINTAFDQFTAQKTGDIKTLKDLQEQAQTLYQAIYAEKPVIKSVASTVEKLIKGLQDSEEQQQTLKAQRVWLNIFEVMEQSAVGTVTSENLAELPSYQALPNVWQKKLNASLSDSPTQNDSGTSNREAKTLELEVLAGVESPEALSAERMKVQVQLMQSQMTTGLKVDLPVSFSEWLQQGTLTQGDVALIARLKPIFCS